MKKLVLFLATTLCFLSSFADSYLYMDPISMKAGETKAVSINLKNDVKITAFQCDIYLPTGVTATQITDADGNTDYNIALTSRKTSYHTISFNPQTDGAMRVVAFCTKNYAFSGSDGALFTMEIKASTDIALGAYSVKIANVELTTPDGTAIDPTERTSALNIVTDYTITTNAATTGGTVAGGGTYSSDKDVTLTATPETGYHFVSWSNGSTANPLVFKPTKTEEIDATFAPNKYAVKYQLDGAVAHTDSVNYGAAITAWTAPAKEGYTFTSWSTIPATMPANDITITGSYTVNNYKLIYMVDGKEYKNTSVAYGTTITPEAVPTKEGYTFSGWSTIPATMPAKDVTVTGTFAVNTYKVTFTIDGATIATKDVAFGSAITAPDAPAKEGYTFAGWSTIPATMPAKDITITGSYTVNSYKLIYMVDGKEYKNSSVAYGTTITPEAVPTKEGYTFSGWSTIPATMPAKDVTVTGTFAVNTYKVTFTIDGATIATKDVAFGSAITAPDAPAKEGYTFAGWSTIPATMPAKDITITGSYTVNSYNLIYKVDGAEYKKSSVTYGTAIIPEAAPTKEGYTFSGWSTIPTTMPAKDVTVTGTFAVNTYKVTFTIDGATISTKDVAFGSAITAPDAPAKEGYTFAGWSTIPATMPAKDITITGNYTVNSYKLIYMVDGKEYKNSSVTYGTAITPEAVPTKEGYTFSGWSTIPATMPAKDVTVTGTFAVNTYKVTFTIDGATIATKDVAFGSAITAPDAPAKEGYTFAGWSTIPATMPAKDITITGSYTVNSYNLIYKVDGAEYKKSSVAYGTAITPEAVPTKEGYTFSGWSTIPATMPAKDVTVTGTFAVNTYTVTYKLEGAVFAVKTYNYGAAPEALDVPAKAGYKFSGWQGLPNTMPAKNIEVTGSYVAGGYNLIYMLDGVEYRKLVVTYGATITPEPAPTKEGYTFSGWSTIPTTMPAQDITVTGTFSINTYKVTFTIDGVTIATKDVTFGGTITAPDAPAKEGYTFSGWSTIPATMPAKDITITGSYAINKYNLTYMLDGVPYKVSALTYGDAITPEAAPTKEGYTFSGWSEIPTTMPAKDVTITGTFTVNSYTITYVIDGATYKTVNVNFGATITALDGPAKEGYSFLGWDTLPTTMPAKNITVTGNYTINNYNITYMVDEQVYVVVSVTYGSPITLIDAPVKEGYKFSGWSAAPATMPAEDIIISGSFTATGIESILGDAYVDVYSIEGRMVKLHVLTSTLEKELTPGLYIINGKKFLIRRR